MAGGLALTLALVACASTDGPGEAAEQRSRTPHGDYLGYEVEAKTLATATDRRGVEWAYVEAHGEADFDCIMRRRRGGRWEWVDGASTFGPGDVKDLPAEVHGKFDAAIRRIRGG